MKHNALKILLLQAILISACASQPTPTRENPGIVLTNCVLRTPGVENQVDAKCGSLAVPEDPSNPESRQI